MKKKKRPLWTSSVLRYRSPSAPSTQASFSLPLRRMTKWDDCEGAPGYPGNNNEGIAW